MPWSCVSVKQEPTRVRHFLFWFFCLWFSSLHQTVLLSLALLWLLLFFWREDHSHGCDFQKAGVKVSSGCLRSHCACLKCRESYCLTRPDTLRDAESVQDRLKPLQLLSRHGQHKQLVVYGKRNSSDALSLRPANWWSKPCLCDCLGREKNETFLSSLCSLTIPESLTVLINASLYH